MTINPKYVLLPVKKIICKIPHLERLADFLKTLVSFRFNEVYPLTLNNIEQQEHCIFPLGYGIACFRINGDCLPSIQHLLRNNDATNLKA